MITVKTVNSYTDKVEKGKDFEVKDNGSLVIRGEYSRTPLKVYAPGAWVDAVVQQDPKPVDHLDLDKLRQLLLPGEPLHALYDEFVELQRRSTVDYTNHNGVETYSWEGHVIKTCNPLPTDELVHRSRVKAVEAKAEIK